MEKQENGNSKDNKVAKDKKKISMKVVIVLAVLIVFGLGTAISLRAEYLKTIEISKNYESVFYKNIQNKYIVFGVTAFIVYIFLQ